MKKIYFSALLFVLFSAISNAQVKIVFTEPVFTLNPVDWDGKSKLELKATYVFRNLGKEDVYISKDNFEKGCECTEILVPVSNITRGNKDFFVYFIYTIDPLSEDPNKRNSAKTEIEKLRKTGGKFSKVITFYIEGEDEVHELYFDGQINFKN
jgi:hypothetical protein